MNDIANKIQTKGRFAFIIPVYNHEGKVADVITECKKLNIPVFVVDDGSTDSTYNKIKDIKGITILRHPENKGKGEALMTGFAHASGSADWAITIDADGQHAPEDTLNLIKAIPHGKRPIVVGMREGMVGPDVPWTSSFGRKFSNFWVICSGGPKVADTQSGFRIYPLPESANLRIKAKRFQFEVEVLVKAHWKKIPVVEAPISVSYRPGMERISHFRPFIDFCRNSAAFTRLICQRIFIPSFIRSKWGREKA
ncbi:MAG: glycosyltransferase family 2 protein [bacterium]|nr:glycosyltransferase family 2 protein [bacterium]